MPRSCAAPMLCGTRGGGRLMGGGLLVPPFALSPALSPSRGPADTAPAATRACASKREPTDCEPAIEPNPPELRRCATCAAAAAAAAAEPCGPSPEAARAVASSAEFPTRRERERSIQPACSRPTLSRLARTFPASNLGMFAMFMGGSFECAIPAASDAARARSAAWRFSAAAAAAASAAVTPALAPSTSSAAVPVSAAAAAAAAAASACACSSSSFLAMNANTVLLTARVLAEISAIASAASAFQRGSGSVSHRCARASEIVSLLFGSVARRPRIKSASGKSSPRGGSSV
mmetsp:Transcript_41911/g.98381  ORF Transcript_41911/g.98381 Transcript_41911/m.98381 type:complete len:291 (+) Transcript_41911:187-1059(+)